MLHSDGRRYRSTALDRALASARTVLALGPLSGLDDEAMRAVLRAAQASSPTSRAALTPRTDTPVWDYRSDLDRHVATRDDLDSSDLGALITELRTNPVTDSPLRVVICGDYLVLDYSHGIADGQFGVMLSALLSAGDTGHAGTVADSLEQTAVWGALWRHYRANPTALKGLWQLRRQHKSAPAPGVARRIPHWRASTLSVAAYLDPATVGRMREWAKATWPGSTTASITLTVWLAALRDVGVAVDDRVMILMSCRRYLDRERAAAQGNFAVGIPLHLPGAPAPDEVAAITRAVTDSGWPIAILGMSEIKARVPGRGVSGEDAEDGVVVGDRIRAAVSDIGRTPFYDRHRWVEGAGPPQLAAYLPPDGPDAVPLLVTEVSGGLTFTASFCTQVVEPTVIEKALQRMTSDPIGLLESVRDGQ